jgi:hypothetical protein
MPAIWAALTAVLGNLVKTQVGFWAASLLSAFGLHLVTQNLVIDPMLSDIQAQIGGLGGTAVAWFAYVRVDDAIGVILSAYGAASAMAGLRLMKKPTV